MEWVPISRKSAALAGRKRNLMRYFWFIEKAQVSLSFPCNLCVSRLEWKGCCLNKASFVSASASSFAGKRAVDLRNRSEYSTRMALAVRTHGGRDGCGGMRAPRCVLAQTLLDELVEVGGGLAVQVNIGNSGGLEETLKIGRASWRERVEISVVA